LYSDYLQDLVDANMEELQEMYDSVVPAFCDAYPMSFNAEQYSFESFIVADHILNYYSIENPLVIVPY
jgi:hypothetical protein